ncbi:glycoside hydrolase family 88 protein [Flammeovirgaceae bacterium SG7u.111]|nr:glycoside hydrolase family 88 protein [Flammeovirgaceae bacterium SG7u.132]WPO33748.1 glycoside hydrolase family 88 protein [Flammeovirgaceae bacterium SG7u.111]
MKMKPKLHSTIIFAFCITILIGCSPSEKKEKKEVPAKEKWSQLMTESEIKRNPEAWMLDFHTEPRWSYVNGLVCLSILKVWEDTDDPKYFDYVKGYADSLINSEGEIMGRFRKEAFNIDAINSGKILFALYDKTGDERYKKAIDALYDQLHDQPRISEGGFWHKKIYPNQMWLDGIYMGSPFYAQYAKTYGDDSMFDDIALQFELMHENARDSITGWYYHGWNPRKDVYWADPETGLSKHFWGRGVGWYYMALIDALDFFPKDHPKRQQLIDEFTELSATAKRWQNEKTGLWYQVLDQGDRKGNYLEATCSSMFAYGLLKGIDQGYLGDEYVPTAEKAYKGIIDNLIIKHSNEEVELTECCAGAGLGPADNLVRNGTYEYYINEKKRSNDGKGTGPFIMASLLYENMEIFNKK